MKRLNYYFLLMILFTTGGHALTIKSTLGNKVCWGETTTLILLQSNGNPVPGDSMLWYHTKPNDGNECSSGPRIKNGNNLKLKITGTVTIWAKYACGTSNNNSGSLPSITITVASQVPTPVISSEASFICEGDNIQLECVNNSSTYLWNTGAKTKTITVSEAGKYSVTISNSNGCSKTSVDYDVEVKSKPQTPIITLEDNKLVSSVDDGIQWYSNDEILDGATGKEYTPISNDNHYVVASNGDCSTTSEPFEFQTLGGADFEIITNKITVSPNPSKDILKIEIQPLTDINNWSITIYSLEGKEVLRKRLNNYSETVSLDTLGDGMYFVKISNGDSQVITKKIVKI